MWNRDIFGNVNKRLNDAMVKLISFDIINEERSLNDEEANEKKGGSKNYGRCQHLMNQLKSKSQELLGWWKVITTLSIFIILSNGGGGGGIL